MNTYHLLNDALSGRWLTTGEAVFLFSEAPLGVLMQAAHTLRQKVHRGNRVSWIIDRNVNYTNVCVSGCKFCNFFRSARHAESYVIDFDDLCSKTELLFAAGGRQLLLQGGLHPQLGLAWYVDLFRALKRRFPLLKLHALGPPEVMHISRMEGLTVEQVLVALMEAGLDSLPGAGAEILTNRVRGLVSPAKCTAEEWLGVMHEAHKLGLTTTATMMFGHLESVEERMEHLAALRDVQHRKPDGAVGFVAFIAWPFQDENTTLTRLAGRRFRTTADEYLRMVAISRLMLPNIANIGASWLTVGVGVGQAALWAGANDFGSVMMEEHVVSVAGAHHSMDAAGMVRAIATAGFEPVLRDQQFRFYDAGYDNPLAL